MLRDLLALYCSGWKYACEERKVPTGQLGSCLHTLILRYGYASFSGTHPC